MGEGTGTVWLSEDACKAAAAIVEKFGKEYFAMLMKAYRKNQ